MSSDMGITYRCRLFWVAGVTGRRKRIYEVVVDTTADPGERPVGSSLEKTTEARTLERARELMERHIRALTNARVNWPTESLP